MTDDEIRRLQAEHWARSANEYHQAGKFHGPSELLEHDPENVHELIKDALQRPMPTSRDFWVRVLSKIPYMGPVRLKTRTGKPGRPPNGNQYDDALDRRRDPYRRLVKLPRQRVLAVGLRARENDAFREAVLRAYQYEMTTNPGNRVTGEAVIDRLYEMVKKGLYQGPRYGQKSVRSVLKSLKIAGIICR